MLLPDGKGTYAGAISTASNIVRGWGNTYSFCNDDRLMRNIDMQIDRRLASFRAGSTAESARWMSMIGVGRSDSFCWPTATKTYLPNQLGHLQVNRRMQSCSERTEPRDFIGNEPQGLNEPWICAFRVGRRIDASRPPAPVTFPP